MRIHFPLARFIILGLLMIAALPVHAQGGDDLPELSETYNKQGLPLAFNYPAGWLTDDSLFDGLVALSNTQVGLDVLFVDTFTVEPGTITIIFMAPPANALFFADINSLSLQDVMSRLSEDSGNLTIVQQPEERTIAGQPAIQALATDELGQDTLITVLEFDGELVLAIATWPSAERESAQPLTQAIVDSIAMQEAEGPLVFTTSSGGLRFEYPGGWLVLQLLEDYVYITNNALTMDFVPNPDAEPFASGTWSGQIIGPAALAGFRLDAGDAPLTSAGLVTGFLETWVEEDIDSQGAVETLSLENWPDAAQVVISTPLRDGVIYGLQNGEDFVIAALFTAPGETGDFRAEFEATLDTLTLPAADDGE